MAAVVMGKFLSKPGNFPPTNNILPNPPSQYDARTRYNTHMGYHEYPSLVFVPPNLISIPASRGSGPKSNKSYGSDASLTLTGQGQVATHKSQGPGHGHGQGAQGEGQGQGQGDEDEFSYDFQSIDRVLLALETCRVTERGPEKGLAMRRIVRLGVIASRSTDVLLVAQLMVNAMVTRHTLSTFISNDISGNTP